MDRPRAPVALRIGLFLLIYGGLHWAYQSLRSSALDPWFIHTLTVSPAAALLDGLWPADLVRAVGPRLAWPGGRLTLLAGCDGFEVMSLFAAAVLVADLSWRRGLFALVAGCAAVWALNQTRIVALYWAFRYERDWFDAIHTVWGPLLLISAVVVIYAWAVMKPAPPAGPIASA
ncbi:MAG: exosortase/archaeosortase family protein [Burkholderiales bacterium]|nr:exosortase/archaeosortase family protein [Burkholderiales bacterium]